jgi:hypothetical protein
MTLEVIEMHTVQPTRHTTVINGNLCYNRRVPAHATAAFGHHVKTRIGDQAEAERLTIGLNGIWAE